MSFAAQFANPTGLGGRLAGWLMALTNTPLSRWALDLLALRPDAVVMEVGCGPGRGLELAARRVPEGRVIGIEPSEVMRSQAGAHLRRMGLAGAVDVKDAPADAIPLATGSIDGAFAVNSSPFWRSLPAGLRELRRVLRPGSPLALVVQPRWVRGDDAARALGELHTQAVRGAGYQHVVSSFQPRNPVGAFAVVARAPV
jgi:SAM-dependent methyltransferase